MLPKTVCVKTHREEKKKRMLAAGRETNTAKCRNKYSSILHAHTCAKLRLLEDSLRRAKYFTDRNRAQVCV